MQPPGEGKGQTTSLKSLYYQYILVTGTRCVQGIAFNTNNKWKKFRRAAILDFMTCNGCPVISHKDPLLPNNSGNHNML